MELPCVLDHGIAYPGPPTLYQRISPPCLKPHNLCVSERQRDPNIEVVRTLHLAGNGRLSSATRARSIVIGKIRIATGLAGCRPL
jgi:hypothetical protein